MNMLSRGLKGGGALVDHGGTDAFRWFPQHGDALLLSIIQTQRLLTSDPTPLFMRAATVVLTQNFCAIRERPDGPAAQEWMCGICGSIFQDNKEAAKSCGFLPRILHEALGHAHDIQEELWKLQRSSTGGSKHSW